MISKNIIRICLQCNAEINDDSIEICPNCQCIDLMDKNNYNEILNNYYQASNCAKQFFYNDPVFIKIMSYKPNEIKRESPVKSTSDSMSTSTTINKPKCPTCGSTKVKKISTASKAIGFALVGIFNSNLGKQMQCENCGYKW